jgi:uncharacterized protein (DUF433 family)
MATTTQWKYLERNLKSSYRQLFVKGTRIRARVLAGPYFSAEEPMTVEQIAADWNQPEAVVREAIAYVQSNPPELEQDYRYEEGIARLAGVYDPGSMGRALRPVSPEDRVRLRREVYGNEARS